MTTDAYELVNRTETADIRLVLHDNVASKGDAIGQNRAVPNDHIVGNVNVSHQQIVIADSSHHAAAFRPPIDRHKLSNGIAVSDASL